MGTPLKFVDFTQPIVLVFASSYRVVFQRRWEFDPFDRACLDGKEPPLSLPEEECLTHSIETSSTETYEKRPPSFAPASSFRSATRRHKMF